MLFALQIVKDVGSMVGQFAQYAAGTHLLAAATGVVTFLYYAVAYLAQVAAIVGLATFGAATHTVDPLGLKLHLVHLAPFLCHFLTQVIVIVQGGYACLALFTVEAAACN